MFSSNDLTQLWEKEWPESPPIAEKLKHSYPDQWIRFYSLPLAKRYPENEEEYATTLTRHNTLLADLKVGETVTIVVAAWTNTPDPSQVQWPTNFNESAHLNYWQTIDENASEDDSEFKSYRHLFIMELSWHDDAVNNVLKLAADNTLSGVIMFPKDISWLYHPYDGGVDIILKNGDKQGSLKQKYEEWSEE
jgi:hypothetical protein